MRSSPPLRLLEIRQKQLIKIIFPGDHRRIFSTAVCTPLHCGIEFFACGYQLHLIDLIPQFPTCLTERAKRIFRLLRGQQLFSQLRLLERAVLEFLQQIDHICHLNLPSFHTFPTYTYRRYFAATSRNR